MAKRSRDSRGWAYPDTGNVRQFLLDINSIETSTTAVEFEYNVSDKMGPLFHNGKLNLRGSNSWSVALSNFSMPNNFESFPSIDKTSNLSAAFCSLQIFTHYTFDDEDKAYVIKIPVKHFPHKVYNAEEVLQTLINLIGEGFIALGHKGDGSGKEIKDKFWEYVGDFYIDPESSFVHFKAKPTETVTPHPFQHPFYHNLGDGVLPHPKKGIKNFFIRSMYIWVGSYVMDYLGEFDYKSLWDHGKRSGLAFHGEVLDKLVFSYSFALKGKHPYLISKESYKKNKNSAIHVKSDVIATAHPNEFGNLAICTIPEKEKGNIIFTPPKLIWRPLRGLEIEKIKFRLTDERGHLLNYSGGYTAMTLLFLPTDLVTF